ncbi:hypothetical protein MRX96_026297 [Rhipicephalus microplus]
MRESTSSFEATAARRLNPSWESPKAPLDTDFILCLKFDEFLRVCTRPAHGDVAKPTGFPCVRNVMETSYSRRHCIDHRRRRHDASSRTGSGSRRHNSSLKRRSHVSH